ncbi:hypothetical protein Nmel_015997 [Mimus melanotis]
MGNDLNSLVP